MLLNVNGTAMDGRGTGTVTTFTFFASKALSKDDLFKQSKTVGKKWWGQSGGKGKRTATVLRADFKAALAKTIADAGTAGEDEL